MNKEIEFHRVNFMVPGLIKGWMTLPFVNTNSKGMVNLASCKWQDIVLNIGNRQIPIKADPETAEEIISRMFGADDPHDIGINIDLLNGIYTINKTDFSALTDGRLMKMPDNGAIGFYYSTMLNGEMVLLPGNKTTYGVEIRLGLGTDLVVDVDCHCSLSETPFMDIKYIGEGCLFFATNFSFDDNKIPSNYTIEVDQGALIISDNEGNKITWEDGYAVVAYSCGDAYKITNLWLNEDYKDRSDPFSCELADKFNCYIKGF